MVLLVQAFLFNILMVVLLNMLSLRKLLFDLVQNHKMQNKATPSEE